MIYDSQDKLLGNNAASICLRIGDRFQPSPPHDHRTKTQFGSIASDSKRIGGNRTAGHTGAQ